jgi:hypothetical protein
VGASAFMSYVDARTEPPVIITELGPEFQDGARPGAMILGMDRTPKGRIWGCWTGTGDKQDGYFILATSDDGGSTWSKPRLVVGALDPSGKRQRGALVGNLWTDPLGRLWLFFDQSVIGIPGPRADWFIRCGVLRRGLHAEQADRAEKGRLVAAGLELGGENRVGLRLDRPGQVVEAARQREVSRLGVRRTHDGGAARRAAMDAGADAR